MSNTNRLATPKVYTTTTGTPDSTFVGYDASGREVCVTHRAKGRWHVVFKKDGWTQCYVPTTSKYRALAIAQTWTHAAGTKAAAVDPVLHSGQEDATRDSLSETTDRRAAKGTV